MINYIHSKKIIIAPLDWGLGHATRCIPLISHLIFLNCDVTIAASGKQQYLLKKEFPALKFLDLPGYNVTYSTMKRWMPFKILIQIPKILSIIRFENKWLQSAITKHHFDAVISDNRYGLYSNKIISVFITHQLQIKASLNMLETIMRRLTYIYINRFNDCWIPDFDGSLNIAGKLSHPQVLPSIPVKYIGPINRFKQINQQKYQYTFIVIISGPEPQRTLFEKKIIEVAQGVDEKFLIVRGIPGEEVQLKNLPNCTVYNHLNTSDMSKAISSGEFIISRCGYTTIMEVLALKKKSIFIPTPGQTEQQYLAKRLMKQSWCYSFSQSDDFTAQILKVKNFKYDLPAINTESYKAYLSAFVTSLQ